MTVNFDNSFVVGNSGYSALVRIMFCNIYRQGVSRYIYQWQSKAYRQIEPGSHFLYIWEYNLYNPIESVWVVVSYGYNNCLYGCICDGGYA